MGALDEILRRGKEYETKVTNINEKIKCGYISREVTPMKTLLLSYRYTHQKYILLTIPYYMRFDSKLIARLFGISKSKAKKYKLSEDIPDDLGMGRGYFHPFYPEKLEEIIMAGIIIPDGYLEFQIFQNKAVIVDSKTVKEVIRKYYNKYKILDIDNL